MPEAATPSGGAEGSARAAGSSPSQTQQQGSQTTPGNTSTPATNRAQTMQERIKASIFGEPQPDEGRALPKEVAPPIKADAAKVEPEAPQASPDGEEAEASESPDAGEAPEGEQTFSTLNELAEGLGWDLDKILDLEASTKINGKEGKVPLREVLKNFQLEGHLNQGLMKLAEERKAFEAEFGRKAGEIQARVKQVEQAVSLAQKILDGEFADVNWQELQRSDPAAFQAQFGAYKMRQEAIQQLAGTVAKETEQVQAKQQADFTSYLAEQSKLLETKIPEWADKSARDKGVAELATTISDAYGITGDELKQVVDHRHVLILRDAAKWQKLQKSKPAIVNKVRAAPKLIKPGSQQSRAAQEGLEVQKDRAKLRSTGKVSDAVAPLKRLLFSN